VRAGSSSLSRAALATDAAELRAELPRLDRAVDELALVRPLGSEGSTLDAPQRVQLYAASALLDTFYTAVERVLERVARTFGTVPVGPTGHTELLVHAGLEVRAVRPRILSDASVSALKRYLAFRHRFRHLYLYDLHVEPVVPLTEDAPRVWAHVRDELAAFADALDELADTLP